MNQHSKITDQHKQEKAYVYVRQSTLSQVMHHQESTDRQYALKDKAIALGWSPSQIRTFDGDLGMSGARSEEREDFKTLLADVSLGEVGAVLALEASRLARSNTDWYRLIEICSLTGTLIIDEDGIYDPADFNDALLLGIKGTMSSAELHFLRARMLVVNCSGVTARLQVPDFAFMSPSISATFAASKVNSYQPATGGSKLS